MVIDYCMVVVMVVVWWLYGVCVVVVWRLCGGCGLIVCVVVVVVVRLLLLSSSLLFRTLISGNVDCFSVQLLNDIHRTVRVWQKYQEGTILSNSMTQPNCNKLFPTFFSVLVRRNSLPGRPVWQNATVWAVLCGDRNQWEKLLFTSLATRRSLVSAGKECLVSPVNHFVKSRWTCKPGSFNGDVKSLPGPVLCYRLRLDFRRNNHGRRIKGRKTRGVVFTSSQR